MSALLFKLRNVPDDEADEVRSLIQQKGIEIYETSAGNWGISMPAIWVQHDDDLAIAKQHLKQYQQERAIKARESYNEDQRTGRAPTLMQNIARRPFASAGIVIFCLFVLYVMISPFVKLAMQS